jgi:hypothetical protein
VKTLTGVVLVPTAAVQRNGDASFVYAVQPDSTVASKDVKILATEGETTAVTGVKSGDVLVTDGFDKLQGGSKIVDRQAQSAAAPSGAATSPAHE